ncbi:MAG TPA: sulfotransferase, partial [Candidatus Aminicenantes bacterium]|nr:sulfotransferase [Candidatus Aminicenantes bacterium]
MNPLPNFLLLGTAKAGTTALWNALRQHPDVFMPQMKEPRYFAFPGGVPRFGGPPGNDYSTHSTVTDETEYRALFAGAGAARARGEASTVYLYGPDEGIAERICRAIPAVKLIAILRQPAERAFSNFVHAVAAGWEPRRRFTEAWADQERRVRENWSPFLCYQRSGFYAERLRPYLERFDRKQLLILCYEDWRDRPEETLVRVLRFLEVDDAFR